ncbi:octanoyltransferase, partial [Striga asiatica]
AVIPSCAPPLRLEENLSAPGQGQGDTDFKTPHFEYGQPATQTSKTNEFIIRAHTSLSYLTCNFFQRLAKMRRNIGVPNHVKLVFTVISISFIIIQIISAIHLTKIPLSTISTPKHKISTTEYSKIGELGKTVIGMLPEDLPFTLFLPSEEAFRHDLGLSRNDSDDAYATLTRVLGFSALPRHVYVADLEYGKQKIYDSISGFTLYLSKTLKGMVVVNGVVSEVVDLKLGEILVHVMNGVVMDAEFELSEEMRIPRKLEIWKMGVVNYSQALKLQEKLTSDRKTHKITDTLLSLQHPPTYTLGKRRTQHNVLANESELKAMGAELYYTERGGDVTFHGPHQAVLYPIVSLRELGLGARKYVEKLELTMIELASLYGLAARAGQKCETGVWIEQRKIGAIGVRISSGITSHGLAFNINSDLSYFGHIVPCGIADKEVTSLQREVKEMLLPHEEVVTEQLISSFVRTFDYGYL